MQKDTWETQGPWMQQSAPNSGCCLESSYTTCLSTIYIVLQAHEFPLAQNVWHMHQNMTVPPNQMWVGVNGLLGEYRVCVGNFWPLPDQHNSIDIKSLGSARGIFSMTDYIVYTLAFCKIMSLELPFLLIMYRHYWWSIQHWTWWSSYDSTGLFALINVCCELTDCTVLCRLECFPIQM